MADYTELQLKAKEAGIKSWHIKSDEVLSAELEGQAVAIPIPVVSEGKITFYWKDNRNVEFSIETQKATPTSLRQATSFASKNSVLVLDSSIPVEKQAIEKLRKNSKYNIEFAEVDSRKATPDKKGAKLDELMELDHKVLVQMVGGSVQDARKTRGELIQQIMGN